MAEAWLAQGHYHAQLGDHEAAAASYAKLVRLVDPKRVEGWLAIAGEYLRIKELASVSVYLAEAHKLSPKDPFVLNELSVLFLARGEYQRAVDLLTSIPDLAPSLESIVRNNLRSARVLLLLKLKDSEGLLKIILEQRDVKETDHQPADLDIFLDELLVMLRPDLIELVKTILYSYL